jgi:hypothetical protein
VPRGVLSEYQKVAENKKVLLQADAFRVRAAQSFHSANLSAGSGPGLGDTDGQIARMMPTTCD